MPFHNMFYRWKTLARQTYLYIHIRRHTHTHTRHEILGASRNYEQEFRDRTDVQDQPRFACTVHTHTYLPTSIPTYVGSTQIHTLLIIHTDTPQGTGFPAPTNFKISGCSQNHTPKHHTQLDVLKHTHTYIHTHKHTW